VRCCYASEDISWLRRKGESKGIRTIVMIESESSLAGQAPRHERRYYISSLEAEAQQLNRVIRSHWSIENSLHWVLDVAFREDDSRIRKDHGSENMTTLRHIALNLLKQDKSIKVGIKSKRKNAGWNERYLLKVLNG
jgi:predicted transposase YbfD/YdcC